jgi:dihydrofolate synthase/folylpolyglutamate synthase
MDYAIVEVGLGGLLDGTNVVNRADKVCVITDIGIDHTNILGDTISKIAYQKAGIIKQENAVFMCQQDESVMTVIEKRCSETNSNLNIVNSVFQDYNGQLSLPLFQQRNLNLAICIVDYVLNRDQNKKLTSNEIICASTVYIPGRMEIISYNNKTVILDGSHNEQKIGALVESMRQQYPASSIALLVSFGENKQTSVLSCLKLLRTISPTIILTAFDIGQDEIRISIKPTELAILAKKVGFTNIIIEPEPCVALELLLKNTANIGLVTGSFYLLNHVRGIVLK